MHKKLIFILLFIFSINIEAQSIIHCPSVQDLKSGKFNNWLPLYIEGEELASDKDVAEFVKNVNQFEAARWKDSYLENAHCFYRGSSPLNEKIIFAHDAWRPEDTSHWEWVTPNKFAECYFESGECGFIE